MYFKSVSVKPLQRVKFEISQDSEHLTSIQLFITPTTVEGPLFHEALRGNLSPGCLTFPCVSVSVQDFFLLTYTEA